MITSYFENQYYIDYLSKNFIISFMKRHHENSLNTKNIYCLIILKMFKISKATKENFVTKQNV